MQCQIILWFWNEDGWMKELFCPKMLPLLSSRLNLFTDGLNQATNYRKKVNFFWKGGEGVRKSIDYNDVCFFKFKMQFGWIFFLYTPGYNMGQHDTFAWLGKQSIKYAIISKSTTHFSTPLLHELHTPPSLSKHGKG